MSRVKAADDYASIKAQLARLEAEKRQVLAGEPTYQTYRSANIGPQFEAVPDAMYGALDPALAQGAEADGWMTYHAADWDPA